MRLKEPWFLFVTHHLNTCNIHALANLAVFQRKGKVVGDVTAGSLVKMQGEPAPCCCSAAASPGVTQAIFAAADKAPGSRGGRNAEA